MFQRLLVVALLGLIAYFGWFIAAQVSGLRSTAEPAPARNIETPPDAGSQYVSPRAVSAAQGDLQPVSVKMIPAPELGSSWPRWRGPSGQGLANGSGYVDTWSESKNVIWKVDVPGRGNSSPIVLQNQIFLTTSYDGGARRSILCFDRSNGDLLWETFAPEASPEQGVHRKNGHASGTPCTDGERVYAFLGAYGILSVGLDGEQRRHQVPDVTSAYHGPACSPLLYQDRLILYQDQFDGSFVSAYSSRTGELLWRTSRSGKVGWGSPVAIRAGDRDLVIVSGERQVIAYDPEDGKQVWSCHGNFSEVIPTPVAGHGLLFCSSGRSGPTLAIHPGGTGDVTDTHIRWLVRDGSPFVPSALLYGDYLYMVDEMRRRVSCYEAQTGKSMWREVLNEPASNSAAQGGERRSGRRRRGGGCTASPVGLDGKVFFTDERGTTFVLKAGPQFKLLHTNALRAPVLASPALVSGRWYFRTETRLICIGADEASAG